MQWIDEGEKNTKFFLSLEKRHQCSNTITALKTDKGTVYNTNEIMAEEVTYYKKLYSSKNVKEQDIDEYLREIQMEHILNENQANLCEGTLNIKECTDIVYRMKKNKSPGSDGLPIEFYQKFWSKISNMVVQSLNFAYQVGHLSSSQQKAIITLLFKKGDRELLKNWRPISLLNTDYKIAAFAMSNRLHKVLSNIINSDQTGYIKKRFIGSNIRLINDIYEYVESTGSQGAAIYCDFEKAFDSVEINLLLKVLEKFNFGRSFIKWIKVFYSNAQASIKCNNWISAPFCVSRGIRQGCPVSALLFILVAEIMSLATRQRKDVKGIILPDIKVKQRSRCLSLQMTPQFLLETKSQLPKS